MRASVRAVGLVPPHLEPDCSGCTPSEWAPRPPSPSQFHWHTRPAPPAGGDAGDAPAQPRKHNCVVFVRGPSREKVRLAYRCSLGAVRVGDAASVASHSPVPVGPSSRLASTLASAGLPEARTPKHRTPSHACICCMRWLVSAATSVGG